MRRRKAIAVVGGGVFLGLIPRGKRKPRAWRSTWVLNDKRILRPSLKTIEGIPAYQAILRSQQDANDQLLTPEPFDDNAKRLRRMDYDGRIVAITSVRLPPDKTLTHHDSNIEDGMYTLKAGTKTPETNYDSVHFEHFVQVWELNGASTPDSTQLLIEKQA